MKVNVTENGKETGVKGVWALPGFDPLASYVATVSTLADGSDRMEVPVASIGQHRQTLQFFAATDLRFVAFPGHRCVMPDLCGQPCSIFTEQDPDSQRWRCSVIWRGERLITSQEFTTAQAAKESVRPFVDRIGLITDAFDGTETETTDEQEGEEL